MSVPFQSASMPKRGRRSIELAIAVTLVLGLVGLSVQGPPLQPPGWVPGESGNPKICPNCGQVVRPARRGRYVCRLCGEKFTASEAEDYR